MKTPLNPILRTAIENIIDNITDAENDTQDNINYSNALPLDTDELTEALRTAKEALKTARLIAEALITARHPRSHVLISLFFEHNNLRIVLLL